MYLSNQHRKKEKKNKERGKKEEVEEEEGEEERKKMCAHMSHGSLEFRMQKNAHINRPTCRKNTLENLYLTNVYFGQVLCHHCHSTTHLCSIHSNLESIEFE